jgi:biotin synthase
MSAIRGLETARDVTNGTIRHDWTVDEILALVRLPFPELIYTAQSIHRRHFDPGKVELAQLLSIKTGGCPEDCGYCAQSVHFDTGLTATKLMAGEDILAEARRAKANGATRFCMGAAWRSPKDRDIDALCPTIEAVKDLGLETCMTLGMLTAPQAQKLKAAGLDFYNHNLDTSPEHYSHVISTRSYADRIETLGHVHEAGIAVCCGGIVGLGETLEQRAEFAAQLAELQPHEVPLNFLNPRPGTPLGDRPVMDAKDALRAIAAFRLALPRTILRYAGGREITLGDLGTRDGLLGGINAVIVGNYLTTLGRPAEADLELLQELKMPVKALSATL